MTVDDDQKIDGMIGDWGGGHSDGQILIGSRCSWKQSQCGNQDYDVDVGECK